MDNTVIFDAMVSKFPEFLRDNIVPDNPLHAILTAINAELNGQEQYITILENSSNIYKLDGQAIDDLWGELLNITRNIGESDISYRSRLVSKFSKLMGGTLDSIKCAIGSTLNISNSVELDARVQVYDTWEYSGPIGVDTSYGNILCVVDLGNQVYDDIDDIHQMVINTINTVKATGINPQIIFTNISIKSYDLLNFITYETLSSMQYTNLGI